MLDEISDCSFFALFIYMKYANHDVYFVSVMVCYHHHHRMLMLVVLCILLSLAARLDPLSLLPNRLGCSVAIIAFPPTSLA